MAESAVLRQRISTHTAEATNRRHQYYEESSIEKRKHGGRNYPFILKATLALFAFIILLLIFEASWYSDGHGDIINLDSIEILSTVPLGFTIDLPDTNNLGALEIYLDSKGIYSIDSPASSSSINERKINAGTCDIGDHGENTLKHAFSIANGGLVDMKRILLKPGNHVVEIQRREKHRLIPYAQMALKVNSPPDLILSSSTTAKSSPYEDAYKLALEEIGSNIACNHFVAGTGWSQLWTRDTSFAAELGAALIHPHVVRTSLMASVQVLKNGKMIWLQDKCGHFGGWPNLSDAIVGVRGAWSLYLVTGDKEFLKWAYDVTKNSLEAAEADVLDKDSGLFLGCSSFLESNSGYPEKYMNDGELVGKTKALSTNMLYYSGYNLASKMGRELGELDEPIQD
eukprot:CAMPEP_0181132424 /NCGR_PEP_ID=MMETSP1071-20121207/30987_1 /TAXON_ID=35127 /ORGANISM="Thalassiosira sp., Strain NH16" /LENGTH=398 /DNA_ID=CAMNT_0023218755 /DNA_START=33 /DNA_END=1229 /DNA_ORIENTATION=-